MDQSQMLIAAVCALGGAILVMWRVDQAKSARALAAAEDARNKSDERWRKEQRDASISLMEINDRVVAALERNNLLISRLLASPCIRGDHSTAELAPPSPVHGWPTDPQPHDLPTPIPSMRPISGERRRVAGSACLWLLLILAALAGLGCAGADIARAEAQAAQARQESAAIAAAVAQVDATNRELVRIMAERQPANVPQEDHTNHTNHTKAHPTNSPERSEQLPALVAAAADARETADKATASVAEAKSKDASASGWADLILAALAGAAGIFLPAVVPFVRMAQAAKKSSLVIATTALHADRLEEQIYHAIDNIDSEELRADARAGLNVSKQIAAGEQAGLGVRKIIQAARGKPV